jgi:hypothetical protein
VGGQPNGTNSKVAGSMAADLSHEGRPNLTGLKGLGREVIAGMYSGWARASHVQLPCGQLT